MRRTLYCVRDRSSALSTESAPRVSMSAVRSKSRNAASSGLPPRRALVDRSTSARLFVSTTIVKTYVYGHHGSASWMSMLDVEELIMTKAQYKVFEALNSFFGVVMEGMTARKFCG
jgi:hypothetical protein